MLKQQVLNEMAGKARASGRHASTLLTGDAWYTQQAMRCAHCHAACSCCCALLAFRHVHGGSIGPQLASCCRRAINQAMGRVIRHRLDYGAIILADERFRSEATRMQLSSWLRGSVTSHDTFGAATKSLQAFYRVRQSDWFGNGMHGLGWEA
jgi:Helicase C-terminal domain